MIQKELIKEEKEMRIHFESNQEYQIDAIKSITDIFEGQPLTNGDIEFSMEGTGTLLSDNGFGNKMNLAEHQIWKNIESIQHRNKITTAKRTFQVMNFSIEMETGTGKTYVYLRTIYELQKLYGFKKFVIVVPSIAIREGVLKTWKLLIDIFNLCMIKQLLILKFMKVKKFLTCGALLRITPY